MDAQLQDAKRRWREAAEQDRQVEMGEISRREIGPLSARMMTLQDMGRFMLRMELAAGVNPFEGPDDY